MTAVQLALCEPTWTDPEPDDQNNTPACRLLDLDGQGVPTHRFWTMTTIEPTGGYL